MDLNKRQEVRVVDSGAIVLTCEHCVNLRLAESQQNETDFIVDAGIAPYPIPKSAVIFFTCFAASFRDKRRVSRRNVTAFSRSPVLTNP